MEHKLHHSYIWLGTIRTIPYILLVIVCSSGQLISEFFTNPSVAEHTLLIVVALILGIVVTTGVIAVIRAISYKYIWYVFANEEFSYHSGVFSKKCAHVPYKRIQSVNQKASLLQRLAGVCTLKIETAGGSDNKSVNISYIEQSAAEELRLELFARKQLAQTASTQTSYNSQVDTKENVLDIPAQAMNDFRGVFGGDEIDTGSVVYEYGLTNKELFLSSVTGKASFALALISIIGTLASLASTGALTIGISEEEAAGFFGIVIDALPKSWLFGIAGIVLVGFLGTIIAIWLVMVLSTCISRGGFRARRRGNRIETEFGILSHSFNGIDIERIQSIEINQSFFQRLLHSCSISLARVTSSNQNSSSNSNSDATSKIVIHPFVKESEVKTILNNLLPEWEDIPDATYTLPKRSLRRAIIRRTILQGSGFWTAVSMFLTMLLLSLPLHDALKALFFESGGLEDYIEFFDVMSIIALCVYILAAIFAVFNIIGAILWQKGSGFGYSNAFMTIVNGGFSTNKSITPRTKIQLASLRTNPLQKRKQLTTIAIETASGVHSSKAQLIDVESGAGQTWFKWCYPRHSTTNTQQLT